MDGTYRVSAIMGPPECSGSGSQGPSSTIAASSAFPSNFFPVASTVGPDGSIWATDGGNNAIAQISPDSSTVTEYPIPTPRAIIKGAAPFGIAAGPDGNLWFTEQGDGSKFPPRPAAIGRITIAGAITEFPLPIDAPGAITAGPDSAMWFTYGAGVGRITTAGTVSVFPTGDVLDAFNDITTGPDGNLWVTSGLDAIQRVTTAGVFTAFPILTSGSGPTAITAGPDGNLWFTEAGNQTKSPPIPGAIGQITPAGAVTEFPLSIANASPFDIGPGLGQTLVFTETGNQSLNPPVPAALGTVFIGFTGKFTLTVAETGTGSGTVTSGPAGINCSPTATPCAASAANDIPVTLTATAKPGSTFAGWSGGGCSGTGTCTLSVTAATTVTATFTQNTSNIVLAAAVLPLSRSVQVGATATAFATIIDAGPGDASSCSIAPTTGIPATFVYQTTNPSTNALSGTVNTPANIAQSQAQTFVIALTPTAAFAPTNVVFSFGCANAGPAAVSTGINILNLSASTSAVPDIVALAASGDPGYVDIPGATGTGVFAVATVNVGSAAPITASADTGVVNLPLTLTLCQTNPVSGACLAAPAASVTTTIAANATPTFGIFATGSAAVANLPGDNRVFVRFQDAGGVLRGETSVAVRTQ